MGLKTRIHCRGRGRGLSACESLGLCRGGDQRPLLQIVHCGDHLDDHAYDYGHSHGHGGDHGHEKN